MTRAVMLANFLGAALAVSLSLLAGVRFEHDAGSKVAEASNRTGSLSIRTRDGQRELRDDAGVWVPLGDYRRIASGSTIVDELLLRFVEPERIVSFTAFSERHTDTAHRYTGKPRLSALDDIETLIGLKPDILILNTLGSAQRAERIREAGIVVFDLGEMRGVETYLDNVRAVAMLVGRPELGDDYARQFARRIERVAADAEPGQRPAAAYLSIFGTSIYSAGRRTSYDDVLVYAGLENVVAKRHTGWPALSIEEVLALDPEYVLTHSGMGSALCALSRLDRLVACSDPQRHIVELPPALLSDPGSGMLRAAEAVHDAIHRKRDSE